MSKTLDREWKQNLAHQIRVAREDFNLTQGELAELVGVSRQMIVSYENEEGVPAIPVIDVFARVAVALERPFRIGDLVVTVEQTSPRLRSLPKQLKLDFEKAQTYVGAVISITPREGQILIHAKIPA
jgi:DNA-binding XRE family transcriptional regulator